MNTPIESAVEPTPFNDGEEYDIFFAEFDYGLAFYLELACKAGGPVLDVACGTGRVLLKCLKLGLDVDGVDNAPAMLATLLQKGAAQGYKPRVYEASMSSFDIDRRYALIMIPFNAFVHNLTTADQIATLKCCREHLQPGGLVAFDGFFPGLQYVGSVENERMLEIEVRHPVTGLPVRLYDSRRFDRVAQIQESINDVELLDSAGCVSATRRSYTKLRWIYKSEMELLLAAAGFERWELLGGFDGRPLIKETDAMVVKAWKGNEDSA